MLIDLRPSRAAVLRTLLLVTFFHPATAGAFSENSGTARTESASRDASGTGDVTSAGVLELAIGGGGLVPWEAMEEAGNGLVVSANYGWSDFKATLSYGAALPDSRSQGIYHNLWSEFGWFFLGRSSSTRFHPYISAGLGFALADDAADSRLGDPVTVRWNSETSLLGIVAFGLRFGESRGLFVDVSLRAFNHTFGGYCLSAGYGF